LKKFARNLRRYLRGLLAHCWRPLHTSLLEGINNKIKVIKRMATASETTTTSSSKNGRLPRK
jgi:transposase